MRAYNKSIVENEALVSEAKALYKMKFISKEQLAVIAEQSALLHSNANLLVRFGFFLLGCFLFSSVTGSVMLILMPLMENNYKLMSYFYVLIGVVGAEVLAAKGYYRQGLDDAFILAMQGAFCLAIGVSCEASLPVFIAMILAGFLCCIRYVHTLSALICCMGLVALMFNLVTEYHLLATLFLPFLGCFLAIAIYAFYIRLNGNPNYYLYGNALRVVKGFALVLGYFSLNYMIVRELSQSLMNIMVAEGNDIPLAFLFYGLTFFVPLSYIVYGIYSRSRIMLIVGLLTLGFSFFTIRYYYELLPLEIELILEGIALFVIAFMAIKVLKNKEAGITFKPERGSDSDLLRNAQALILSTQTVVKPTATESKMPFGGGGFSGGGSGDNF